MDLADDAQKAEALILAEAHYKSRHPELSAVGFCHYCGEAVKPGLLFCLQDPRDNGGCRDDYERLQAARKRNGG